MTPFALSHEQTLKYAALGAVDMVALIHAFIQRIPSVLVTR
jgi:xanthosine phosphorylase